QMASASRSAQSSREGAMPVYWCRNCSEGVPQVMNPRGPGRTSADPGLVTQCAEDLADRDVDQPAAGEGDEEAVVTGQRPILASPAGVVAQRDDRTRMQRHLA